MPALTEKYRNAAEAAAIVQSTAQEIDIRRRFGNSYGYAFFVATKCASHECGMSH